MLKIWKLTLRKVSGVNDTLRHTLFRKSPSTKDFWERETLRLVPRDPNLVKTTNNINVLVPISASLQPPSCTHGFLQLVPLDLPEDSPRLSLRELFLQGHQRGMGNSSSNNWLSVRLGPTNVFQQDDALFWHASKFNSKTVAKRLLHSGFKLSLMNFISIILIFTKTDSSLSDDVSMIYQRYIEDKNLIFLIFNFYSSICSPFVNFSYTIIYSPSAIIMLQQELQIMSHLVTQDD